MSARPVPRIDDDSRPYWEGARRHELVILRCQECAHFIHYPRRECPKCGSTRIAPARVSGRGVVHSYTVTHHKGAPGFADATPYVVVLVELEEQEGLRVIANLRGCRPEDARVGMPVEVVFEDVSPEISLPQFQLRRDS